MKVEDTEIVVVGGGITGLATALALHRKGIKSVVLERSESLGNGGSAIGIHSNGWRALDQLGIANSLRQTALRIHRGRDILLDGDSVRAKELSLSNGEARCLKRSDLITSLANDLPTGTICFGAHIVSVKLDPLTSFPTVQLGDGRTITAKVLIGCDGANSVVANFLELKPTKVFSICAVRGFTYYPKGHGFEPEFSRLRPRSGQSLMGRSPVDDKLVYWFVCHPWSSLDMKASKDPAHIMRLTLGLMNEYPKEMVEMVTNSDLESLSLTHLRYRAPWDIALGTFRSGTVTVAGDALHVMGPFLGQGGSAGLEDAVVLARCLAPKMTGEVSRHGVEAALDEYWNERKTRVLKLSTQTYLTGLLLDTSSFVVKLVAVVFMKVLFRDVFGHTRYDCGQL